MVLMEKLKIHNGILWKTSRHLTQIGYNNTEPDQVRMSLARQMYSIIQNLYETEC